MLLNHSDGTVAVCHNLRPAEGSQGLSPIPAPQKAAACPLRIFCEFGSDGLSFIAADGKHLSLFFPQRRTEAVRALGELPDKPLRARFIDNVVVVTTEKGEYRIDYDPATDTFSHRGYPTDPPAVSIEAVEAAVVTVTVPGTNLSKSASPGRRLSDTDVARLSDDLVGGYNSLLQSAGYSGAHLQPVVAFYRLLDADNNEIYRSAPSLVALPDGPQVVDSVTLKSTDTTFTAVESYRLEAPATKVRVNIDAPVATEGDRVARLEVWLSPQLHPFDPSRKPDCRLLSRSSSADFASLSLPGMSAPTSIATRAGRRMVEALVAFSASDDFHAVFRRALTLDRPFDAPGVHDVPPAGADVAADIAVLRAALARRFSPCSRLEALTSGAHTVVPALSAEAADARLGADLRIMLTDAISPRRFAVASTAGQWRSVVTVDFADGSVLSRTFSGSASAPSCLSPVIAYPDPTAVALTVTLQCSGSSLRKRRFDLAPDPSGRFAAWIAPDFLPVTLDTTSDPLVMLPSTASAVRFPDALVLTGSRAGRVSATLRCPGLDFMRLLPAMATSGAWDYGRARFFVFSRQGIFTATTSASRSALSLNCLDPRPVTAGEAVAEIDGGRVAAVAGGDLVEVSRAKVATIVPGIRFDRIGWHPFRRELWCFSPDAPSRVFFPAFGWRHATADLGAPEALCPSRRFGLVLTGSDSVSVAEPLSEPSSRLVRWRGTARFPTAVIPAHVKLPASASQMDAVLEVAHGHVASEEAPVASFAIKGRLAAPLARRLFCRPVDCLTVGFAGTVSPDFLIYRPEIFSATNGKHTRHLICP